MKESFFELRPTLASGEKKFSSIVAEYLNRIDETADLNAYLETYRSEAERHAAETDALFQNGKPLPLSGLTLSVKDLICQKDHRINAGSKILGSFQSLYSSTGLQRLLDQGAMVLGRVNCDEFGMGSSNENSAFGLVKNPLDKSLTPGGSSGGSAASVAAGLCHVSLGTDTGGSVRMPASFCGVYGLKPTYGRISRYGVIAYASSFDQIGLFARSVEDIALTLGYMAGHDPMDDTSSTAPVADYLTDLQNNSGRKYKIGIISETVESSGLDPEIRAYVKELSAKLTQDGHTVESINFPYLDYVVPTYYILTTAEASSNLSRYDGIRYGRRAEGVEDLMDVYLKSRSEGFGKEVKRRIMLGTFVLSAGYFDAYYSKAQKVRRLIADYTRNALSTYDFILTPTTTSTAFPLGAKAADPIAMYLSDIYTVHANLAGNPAISVPMGKHSNGLPFGIQLLGGYFEESKLLSFSKELMRYA